MPEAYFDFCGREFKVVEMSTVKGVVGMVYVSGVRSCGKVHMAIEKDKIRLVTLNQQLRNTP